MPFGAIVQSATNIAAKSLGNFRGGFQMQGFNFKHAFFAMRLGVQSADDFSAREYRQHEIAIDTLCLRGVALDAVIEIE